MAWTVTIVIICVSMSSSDHHWSNTSWPPNLRGADTGQHFFTEFSLTHWELPVRVLLLLDVSHRDSWRYVQNLVLIVGLGLVFGKWQNPKHNLWWFLVDLKLWASGNVRCQFSDAPPLWCVQALSSWQNFLCSGRSDISETLELHLKPLSNIGRGLTGGTRNSSYYQPWQELQTLISTVVHVFWTFVFSLLQKHTVYLESLCQDHYHRLELGIFWMCSTSGNHYTTF